MAAFSHPVYSQDMGAMEQKMKELQNRIITALQLRQQKEFGKAAEEYEKALALQMELFNMAQGVPELQKTMIAPIIDTTYNIAYCYNEARDIENTVKYSAACYTLAAQYLAYERAFDALFLFAELMKDSDNFELFSQILGALNTSLSQINVSKVVDELFLMSGDPGECIWKIKVLNTFRTYALDYLQMIYDMNKYDKALAFLEDKDFMGVQSPLERINIDQLDGLYQQYRVKNKSFPPDLFVLFFTINMDNTVQKYLLIMQKGMCYRGKGDYQKAIAAFDDAEKFLKSIDIERQKKVADSIFREMQAAINSLTPENKAVVTDILKNIKEKDMAELISILYINNRYHRARTYQKMGDHGKALEMFNEIVKECEKLPYHRQYILPKIQIAMADSYFFTKSYDRVREFSDKARTGYTKIPIDFNIIWKIHNLNGRLYELQGESENALKEYDEAVKNIEHYREAFPFIGGNEEFFGERIEPFEGMVRILAEKGESKKALAIAEKAKARSMFELMGILIYNNKVLGQSQKMNTSTLKMESDVYDKNKMEMLSLIREYKDCDAFIRLYEYSNRPEDVGKIEMIQKKMSDLKPKFIKITKENYPELSDLISLKIDPPDEVQKLIGADTVAFEYFYDTVTEEKMQKAYLWVVTSDSMESFELNISPRELERKVRDFRRSLAQKSDDCSTGAAEFYRLLIEPGQKYLSGKKRIIIIPHKVLHYLPFSVLSDSQGNPLIKNYSVVYEPSFQALKICKSKISSRKKNLIAYALGNATTPDGLSPLPGTLTEAEEIRKIFPSTSTIVKEKDFKKENLINGLPGKDMVHFATHGIVDADHPYSSGISTSDGTLTIEEILNADTTSLKFNLVALSACNTGIGKLFPGDDQVGLTRAIMTIGTPSILSSLWSVSDESTAKLMKYFYENFSKGMDKGESLRQAELKLMAEYPHPFYWAPFILTGDWK